MMYDPSNYNSVSSKASYFSRLLADSNVPIVLVPGDCSSCLFYSSPPARSDICSFCSSSFSPHYRFSFIPSFSFLDTTIDVEKEVIAIISLFEVHL